MKMSIFSKLLRVDQWYKNLIVLLPLLFADHFRTGIDMLLAVLGFCLISSVTYMINDWIDRKKDRLHPIKKTRPFASGEVSGMNGLILGLFLILLVVVIVVYLDVFFGVLVGAYFVSTNLYSFGLKNIPLLDVSMIAFNFVLRMSGGFEFIDLAVDWPYFALTFSIIVMFLSHKRRSDIKLMGKTKSVEHKPVLKYYSTAVVYILRILSYGVITWSLFAINLDLLVILAVLNLLFTTSVLFAKDPNIVIKPLNLFKKPIWLFGLSFLIFVIFLQ